MRSVVLIAAVAVAATLTGPAQAHHRVNHHHSHRHHLHHNERTTRHARHDRADANGNGTVFLPHPAGCPPVEFCACGAAVRVFGHSIRDLWAVSTWRRLFARAAPAPGNVALEHSHSHLFVLEEQVRGDLWLTSDYNSGGHQSRRHVRSIAGLEVVNPHSGRNFAQTGEARRFR